MKRRMETSRTERARARVSGLMYKARVFEAHGLWDLAWRARRQSESALEELMRVLRAEGPTLTADPESPEI